MKPLLLPLLLNTLFLSACSENGSTAPDIAAPDIAAPDIGAAHAGLLQNTVAYYAEIHVSNLSINDEYDGVPDDTSSSHMVAVFTAFPNRALTDLLVNSRSSAPGCKISRQSIEEIAAEQAILNAQYPLADISDAGESVLVTTPTSSWPSMQKTSNSGAAYTSDWTSTMGTLPPSSSITITGGEFPAIGEVDLPFAENLSGVVYLGADMQALTVTSNTTAETTVQWDADSTSSSRMMLSFLNDQYDSEGNLESLSSIVCNIPDTGSFTLPDEIKRTMDVDYKLRTLSRFNDRVEKRGDTLIYLRAESRSL